MIITEKLEGLYLGDLEGIRGGLTEALEEDFSRFPFHVTRRTEWPWAMQGIPGHKPLRILDIGSDPLFSAALVVMRPKSEVFIHRTHEDADDLTMTLYGMEKNYRGFWYNYRERVRMLVGLPVHLESALRPELFDVVTCISVIEHVPSKEVMGDWLRPMWRLLAPGGRLIMTMDWSEGGDDVPGTIQNHDISGWLKEIDGVPRGLDDTPFGDVEYPSERKTFGTLGEGMSPISVFGFTVEKAS